MSACKGCGVEIVWGITDNGKSIPLDLKAPVYSLQIDQLSGQTDRAVRMANTYVSHFATCPQANTFSGSKKKYT